MKTFSCFSALWACALLTGCGGYSHSPSPVDVAAVPPTSDVMRVGDKITVRVTGTPDGGSFTEMQIPASGDITMAYLSQPFHAVGRNPADLAVEITDAYKSQKIYTNPVVTILAEERYVNVGGDVRSPSRVIYTPDATVMSTINSCGGFTEFANRRAVLIIRGQQRFVVDCVKAVEVPGANPRVYPGDEIHVPRTPF
jgi:polysaccharide biosynthesis/export protein VpsN